MMRYLGRVQARIWVMSARRAVSCYRQESWTGLWGVSANRTCVWSARAACWVSCRRRSSNGRWRRNQPCTPAMSVGIPPGVGAVTAVTASTPKRVASDAGPVDLDVPRDRAGTFEPRIVPTGATRLAGLSEMIVAWYTNGHVHLRHPPADPPDVGCWHFSRARLEGHRRYRRRTQRLASQPRRVRVYPIVYIDALVVKVPTNSDRDQQARLVGHRRRRGGTQTHSRGVANRRRGRSQHFPMTVLSDIKNRGVADVIFVWADGLKGLPDAIEATWPTAITQTCVVHLVRASLR